MRAIGIGFSVRRRLDPVQQAYVRAVRRFGAIPGAEIFVTAVPASGGRPVVVLRQASADRSHLTVQTHFHGDQLYDQDVDYDKHIGETVAAAWQKDANTVFVLPEAQNEYAAPRTDWSNLQSVPDTALQAVEASGLSWDGVVRTVVSGHSAGGSAIALALARGDDGLKQYDRIELYDAAVGSTHNPVSTGQRALIEAYCRDHEDQFLVVPGVMQSSWLTYVDRSRWTAPYTDHWSPLWTSLGQFRCPATA